MTARLALLATTLALAGCGLATGVKGGPVSVVLTRDFGARQLAAATDKSAAATAVALLRRSFPVTLDAEGAVQSIDGVAGLGPERWSLYVNGVAIATAPAKTTVHSGDRVWWDLHDTSAGGSAPAVVGSFPEPFLHGTGGKRLPTTIECASDVSAACTRVASTLSAAGVPTASQLLGTGSGTDSLAVLVGTWAELKGSLVAALVDRGPSVSGIYARFQGDSLELFGADGRVVRTLQAGAGLIAASRDNVSAPAWLITGTDRLGVDAAADALTARRLRAHYALAVDGGLDVPLPAAGG